MKKIKIFRYFSSRKNIQYEKSEHRDSVLDIFPSNSRLNEEVGNGNNKRKMRHEKMVLTKPNMNSSENEEQGPNSSIISANLLSSKNNKSPLQTNQSYNINTEENLIDYTQLFRALVKQENRKNPETEIESKEKGIVMNEKSNLPNDKATDSISNAKTGTTPVPVVTENKTIAENTDNKQLTKGDLSDLFAKNVVEDSKSNKLATSMEDVNLNNLLAEGRDLLNRLKNSN